MKKNSLLKSIILYICIIIVMLSMFLIVDDLLMYRARKLVENGDVWDGVEQYGKLVSLIPDSSIADDALYEAGAALWEFPLSDRIQLCKVSTEGTVTSTVLEEELDMEVALNCWLSLAKKYPDSSLAKAARVRIAEVYYHMGLWENVIDELEGSPEEYKEDWDRAAFLKAGAYIRKGRPDDAITLIEGIKQDLTPWLRILKGDALAEIGELDLAGDAYSSIDAYSLDTNSAIVRQRLLRLECLGYDKDEGGILLQGKIDSGESSLAGIEVRAVNKYNEQQIYITYTDKKGVYRFETLPEGVYLIEAFVPAEILQNKYLVVDGPSYIAVDVGSMNNIDFHLRNRFTAKLYRDGHVVNLEWQDYPGASGYRMNIGEVVRKGGTGKAANPTFLNVMGSTVVKQQVSKDENWTAYYAPVGDVPGTKYEFDAARENGRHFADMIGKAPASPGFVLGMPYYGGEFAFKVQALDGKGEVISESNECLTAFLYEDTGKINELIINYRFEGAKDMLEDADSPGDLEILARLYQATFKFDKSAEVYYSLFGKTGKEDCLVKALEMWEKAEDYEKVVDILEIVPRSLREKMQYQMAKSYLWSGEMEKAGQLLDSADEKAQDTKMHVLYHMLAEEYDKAAKIEHPYKLQYFGYVVGRGIRQMEMCTSEAAMESFKGCIKKLDSPREDSMQKFIVEYRGFRDAYKAQYPEMEALLLELGRIYWEI
ncbi:MAG: hypothetical protein HPY66_0821 [Firmicutes bacterium]|nr:hypothetical protein [Bacillota bacterium]MDI6705546.1 carboxypeptidase-like regulatory domain-containing protein [Bacillota bacterium]